MGDHVSIDHTKWNPYEHNNTNHTFELISQLVVVIVAVL